MTQGTGTIQVTNTQILSSGVNVNYGNTDSRSKLMMTNFVITEGRDIESYNDQPPVDTPICVDYGFTDTLIYCNGLGG
ncbi:hypothetical protein [Vulcanisaeta souniana]|uniref:Uncharacterized protein n=1 Tax=Vulcanisaeta souniana JCM 11219 TaxID=1293586 RepID=A0A830EEN9_9CREN|nr:hypothetical protein [Vulcanisaeta souniana]BDR92421.1 hypothetical protein Vsou_15140 [Vulcanisaeta souniana JCM 11219]GGI75452.1 hypothetical protein GCM10007112_10300 [Vulcanisaeta souniana JCM 11219]